MIPPTLLLSYLPASSPHISHFGQRPWYWLKWVSMALCSSASDHEEKLAAESSMMSRLSPRMTSPMPASPYARSIVSTRSVRSGGRCLSECVPYVGRIGSLLTDAQTSISTFSERKNFPAGGQLNVIGGDD